MAKIRITDLRLRTIIGTYDWERETKQEVVVNIVIDFDASKASVSDDLKDTLDYKAITEKIIKDMETSSFFLLEKLGRSILDIVMENVLVSEASVRVDKPNALRFADSVSVELNKTREQ